MENYLLFIGDYFYPVLYLRYDIACVHTLELIHRIFYKAVENWSDHFCNNRKLSVFYEENGKMELVKISDLKKKPVTFLSI